MPQSLTKINGLYVYPSEVSKVPDGALFQADNVVIDRDSVFECRPGFKDYLDFGSPSDIAKQVMPFKNKTIIHYGTTLAHDNSGSYVAYSGSYSEPSFNDSYVPKIKYQEANSNLYFTTDDGVYKLDTITATPVLSGAPQGLDSSLTFVVDATGFFSTNNQVAYRVVWGYKDANNNLILGSPGQRAVLANSSGGSGNVTVSFTIPQGVTTSYFYQVYRSALSGGSAIEPNDELGLVYEANPTSAEISARTVSFLDSTPDTLRGATIYTASSQQGILQSNDRPPAGKDVALFKNCLFLANTVTRQRLGLTLLSALGSSGLQYRSFTGNISSGVSTVTNVASNTGLVPGMTLAGAGIQAGTTIVSVTGAGPYTINMSLPATATTVGVTVEAYDVVTIGGVNYLAAGAEDVAQNKFLVDTSASPATRIANTAQSLCRVINRSASNTTINAYYLSGFADLPGKILLEARTLGVAAFTATTASHGSVWSPALPSSGTQVQSSNDAFRNALFVSKSQQPEAFPLTQFFRVGAADSPIQRIIALRESLIILKDEGVFRLTGDTPQNFVVTALDNTVSIQAPETVVRLNNQVYALTNQGVATISDTGVGIISRPIENVLLAIQKNANHKVASFGIAYESARKYILSLPSNNTEQTASQQYVYNTFTNTWVRWTKIWASGVVNPPDDRLYLGAANDNMVKAERKVGNYTDCADEDVAVTVVSSNLANRTVVLSSVSGVDIGDSIDQSGGPFSNITAINIATNTITLDVGRSFSAGAATVHKKIISTVTWAPIFQGNPGILKQCRDIIILCKQRDFQEATLTVNSNIIPVSSNVTLQGFRSNLWGFFSWGEVPWGEFVGSDKLRTYIPANHQYNEWLNITFEHSRAYGVFGIQGLVLTFRGISERVGR